ncbi:MAG TPA: hypothetical protein VLJ61_04660 [Pyrinomonadaceae bacterium]|nr:hypothetical protein [Pyrinomonadaceae bacterium]
MNSPFSSSALRLASYGCLILLALACVGTPTPSRSVFGQTPTPTPALQADLVAGKGGDETVAVGGQITYSLSVFNNGPDDATNVMLVDTLPAHTTFVSADGNGGTVDFSGNTLTVTYSTLAAFDTANVALVVSVDDDTPRGTTITNTVNVASSVLDPDSSNNSASVQTLVTGPFAGDLLISEFRLRGPGSAPLLTAPTRSKGLKGVPSFSAAKGGALPPQPVVASTPDTTPQANDEFIELYNNTDTPLSVNTTDGSSGWAVAASDGIIRFVIPNGTTIPARGHYLGVNTNGYSLTNYPSGNDGSLPTTATGDATYTLDILDNAGIAVFRTSTTANFSLATRLDAVGSTSEANTLYKEGTGYPALTPFNIDYAFVRDMCGKGGSITALGPCPTGGLPKDTDNNAADFYFVDTNGTSAGAGQRLGAPGPENLSSPTQQNNGLPGFNLDRSVNSSSPPNRMRDFTSDPANNSTFGTLDLRRRVTNNTGFPVTRLRFRVIDITTFPAPSGTADLRPRTSTAIVVSGINDAETCGASPTPCTVTVQGTTLEQPPSQPNGGGFNSSLSAGTVTLATPLAPGDSINVRFLLGIQQTGSFRVFFNVEALADQSGGGLSPNNPAARNKAVSKAFKTAASN